MSDPYIESLRPHERPMFPGSPATPDFSRRIRFAYGCVGVLLAFTSAMGTALITVNLPSIQGTLGLDPAQASWLPTAYVMTTVSMNLLLVKFRQQYGLRLFVQLGLGTYLAAVVAHLLINDFASALIVRAASGIAAAPLSSLGVFYLLQAFPASRRLSAFVLALGLPLVATPLARCFSPDLLQLGQFRTLYLIELALALATLAAVLALRLPPSERVKVFEWGDFVTYPLVAVGLALICAVLGQGRLEWWFDAPWIGVALAVAVVLIIAALAFEWHRPNPLIDLTWAFSPDFMGFMLIAVLTRVILSEQSVGAAGLLATVGMGQEQTRGLYLVVMLATLAGTIVGSLTISQKTVMIQIMIAVVMVAIAAFLDSHANALTRPAQLYVSQSILGFASALLIAPTLLIGFVQVLQRGWRSFPTLVVSFGVAQNLGALFAIALLQTFQYDRTRFHYAHLIGQLDAGIPLVAERLRAGPAALVGQVTREANVLAYNDVFLVILVIAVLTLVNTAVFTLRAIAKMKAAQRAVQ
ncbi:MFS transporter [uncultured Caulobacter sp.]|uniref:MFS transporter n=1 Tax=uncultured Caulobacter sp. TaxID=158749 RepID=UPI0026394B68|nr:MFS transporter [uncultured Caulobacter sp.]